MSFTYNDGGREDAGYKGDTRDCVCRAIAIVTGKGYQDVYNDLIEFGKRERISKRKKSKSHPRTGIFKQTIRKYMESLGWEWYPTMGIGTGCTVHLKSDELIAGRLLVSLSRHTTAVIDGHVHDTYDPSRNGTRCVYGFYREP